MKIKYPFNSDDEIFGKYNHLHDCDDVKSVLIYDSTPNDFNPVISIVIPVFDGRLLKKALDSAIGQDFSLAYEIVIVDNNGINNDFVVEYLKENANGIARYFRNEKNIGLYNNWTRCALLAQADYLTFLHADDYLMADTLTSLWNVHSEIPSESAVIGRFNIVNQDGTYKNIYLNKGNETYYKVSNIGLFFDDSCTGCGSLLNKRVVMELGGWNAEMYPASDRILLLNYATQYGLYRVNKVVREETEYISTSLETGSLYPQTSYYLSKAVMDRFLKFKPIWRLYMKAGYIVMARVYHVDDSKNTLITILYKFIWMLYRRLYFSGRRHL